MEQTALSFNVLETIQKISDKLYESELKPEITATIQEESQQLADYLHITEQQVWLFSIIYIQQYMGFACDLIDLLREINLKSSKFVQYRSDLVALIDKKIIKSEYDQRNERSVPRPNFRFMMVRNDVLEAIFNNLSLEEATKSEPMDIYEFCSEVSDLIKERAEKKITNNQLVDEVGYLESTNPQVEVIKKLIDKGISIANRILLYEICDDMVQGGETAMEITIRDIYDSQRMRIRKIREITENTSQLIQENLINIIPGAFVSEIRLVLTSSTIELMLGQDAEIFIKKQTLRDVITAESVAAKELYFEEKLQKQIDFFRESLTQDKFTAMQERLQEMAMPKGVAAVFYGAPGTGKTESVYQIAKATGRDILYVDISQTKSMWFGESEKRIKAVFSDYARLCRKSKQKPILLFNEADAVLGKRKDNGVSNTAQTENAIQNIILEQMEKSEGIIVATTNLVDNLDAAFERRFLFKLKFDLPTAEAKKHIWKSKLNWLTNEQAATLADRFQFSGGEIDNIARKAIINEVISGNRANIDELLAYCEEERLMSKRAVKVGYN
ncbi:MAG: ATP-binding protein [Paludibacter sp.]